MHRARVPRNRRAFCGPPLSPLGGRDESRPYQIEPMYRIFGNDAMEVIHRP